MSPFFFGVFFTTKKAELVAPSPSAWVDVIAALAA
jgi:hypothetical protein